MYIKKRMPAVILCSLINFLSLSTEAQTAESDSGRPDYRTIYSHCLDANVTPALQLLEQMKEKKISAKDELFKTAFEKRFKFADDRSDYLKTKNEETGGVLAVFQKYWRQSLLDTSKNYDASLMADLKILINNIFPETKTIDVKDDSIGIYVKRCISNRGFYTTDGIGKTGRLFDLLIWKAEKDTTYSFKLNKEKISAEVVFMNGFVTLGWEEYATLGRYYPGGWATDKALFCVKKAYNLTGEDFLISYLAHESRHFSDYKLFPKLKNSADLEYRAKLTELSMAEKTIFTLIDFFIANANYSSGNGHSVANYCVIRDLSRALFGVEFEKDLQKWKSIPTGKLNKAAYKILRSNTKAMQKAGGASIEKYINK
jgi:hypothetical protein